jgi:hypothetical protein
MERSANPIFLLSVLGDVDLFDLVRDSVERKSVNGTDSGGHP